MYVVTMLAAEVQGLCGKDTGDLLAAEIRAAFCSVMVICSRVISPYHLQSLELHLGLLTVPCNRGERDLNLSDRDRNGANPQPNSRDLNSYCIVQWYKPFLSSPERLSLP